MQGDSNLTTLFFEFLGILHFPPPLKSHKDIKHINLIWRQGGWTDTIDLRKHYCSDYWPKRLQEGLVWHTVIVPPDPLQSAGSKDHFAQSPKQRMFSKLICFLKYLLSYKPYSSRAVWVYPMSIRQNIIYIEHRKEGRKQ